MAEGSDSNERRAMDGPAPDGRSVPNRLSPHDDGWQDGYVQGDMGVDRHQVDGDRRSYLRGYWQGSQARAEDELEALGADD